MGLLTPLSFIRYFKKIFFCLFNDVHEPRIYDSFQSIIKRFLEKPGFKVYLILRSH